MMAESFASIGFSMLLAVVLIYMVLAAQFESLIHPFTVMLSLPLSIVGALGFAAGDRAHAEHLLHDRHDHADGAGHQERHPAGRLHEPAATRGMGKNEALLTAGPVRLRPILMTAFSTIAGMLPVAIGLGSGAETRAPMGTAIVGGMLTSTILTLVVIPVMYSVMDDLAGWMKRSLLPAAAAPEVASGRGLTDRTGDRPVYTTQHHAPGDGRDRYDASEEVETHVGSAAADTVQLDKTPALDPDDLDAGRVYRH